MRGWRRWLLLALAALVGIAVDNGRIGSTRRTCGPWP
jgi:hypothetical protein